MTPQEESMLNDLIGRVEQTQLTEKDPEAEQLLNQRLGRNPNALYILAQTVLVQNYALEQAQAQLSQLRQQTQALQQQPAHSTSFLGNLLGHRDPAPPPPPPPPPPPGYGAPPYAQPWNQARPRVWTASAGARGWLELLAHRRDDGGGRGCRRARLSGGRVFARWVWSFSAVSAVVADSLAAARAGQRKPSSTTTTMTPAGNAVASTIPSLGDSGSDAANLQQASDDLRDDGGDQDDLSLDDTSYDDSSFDDSSGGDDLA